MQTGKWLIIDESLFSVIYFLLSPIPEDVSVLGSSTLISHKKLYGPNAHHNQVYIIRPEPAQL